MAKLAVYDWNKKETGSVEVPDGVFTEEVRKDLMQAVVKWQLACRRRGTHSTKTRGEVRGGGKKPFKQKGTGNARQGSTRSPLNESGGVAFGPKPRDYSYTLPKKTKQAGLRNALTYLKNEGRLFVVKDMESAEGKTKELSARLQKFGVNKTVLVDSVESGMFVRASQNLKNYRYYKVDGLNVYDLLKFDSLVITESSLNEVVRRCGVQS